MTVVDADVTRNTSPTTYLDIKSWKKILVYFIENG